MAVRHSRQGDVWWLLPRCTYFCKKKRVKFSGPIIFPKNFAKLVSGKHPVLTSFHTSSWHPGKHFNPSKTSKYARSFMVNYMPELYWDVNRLFSLLLCLLVFIGYPGYPSHTIMRAQAKLRIVRAFKPICQIEYLQRQWSGATGWVNLVNTVWVKFKERPNICYIEKVMERGPKKSKYGTTALWHYGTMTLGHDGTTASKKI